MKEIYLDSEYIRLDSLLKLADLVSSGGEAKLLIQNGDVIVNGEVCTARGKKLYPGDTAALFGETVSVAR